VKNHYLKPGLLQDDLDEFWLFRHRASQALLARLDEIEDALRSLWAEARSR
jgi:homoserine kinase type II